MIRKIFIFFSCLLFIYMFWPGPGAISEFKPLPNSAKSTLSGDTYQIPNVAAYFSDYYRDFTVRFYSSEYKSLSYLPFAPVRLNHPPEFSWNVIKKHTDSTYLEELVYPLRDSLYVNGFEPFYPDASPKFWGSSKMNEAGQSWFTKATLRFYPSGRIARLMVWMSIVSSVFLLYRMGKKILA